MRIVFILIFIINSISYALYRQEITITNSTATSLSDYQVKISIDSTKTTFWDNVKNDGGDIRFKDAINNYISYWVESFNYSGKTANIWVRVPSIPASGSTKIYLDFGDSSLTSLSNGYNTFDFYDDFLGASVNTGNWNITDATGWSVANGELKGTNTTGRLTSVKTFNPSIVLESKLRIISKPTNGFTSLSIHSTTTNTLGYCHFYSATLDYRRVDSTWTSSGTYAPLSTDLLDRIIVKSGNLNDIYSINYSTGATIYSATALTKTVSNMPIMIGKKQDDTNSGQTYEAYWDWIFVRKYNSPEPTASLGTTYSGIKMSIFVTKDNLIIEGVQITLTNLSDSSTTTITTSFGVFSDFFIKDVGKYKLSFSKSGYAFVPNNIEVDVTGTTDIAQKVLAYTSPSLSEVQVVNNPFTPTSTDGRFNKVRFLVGNSNNEEVSLKIYNVNGGFLREISNYSGEISWDGKDSEGNIVRGGIYLYQLKLGGNVLRKGTVVLIK